MSVMSENLADLDTTSTDELAVTQTTGIAEFGCVSGRSVETELPEHDDDDRREEQEHQCECPRV